MSNVHMFSYPDQWLDAVQEIVLALCCATIAFVLVGTAAWLWRRYGKR